ncbi:LysR family transcriptional regulator [Sphingosinicella sp. LHD-64]|uniref:LysR family transcriptional regulator n=1 Tax=Sphingosinicella sp. LHD-64 TaxID=3072139 RepID=UPI00280D7EE8|nr:LysR family transcriptional regulator [Sphingosinicella sp. LHD-64]MDQ8756754.1 LysR family transcriptional regulator [Sphingosinicella sp. LHD-64]
MALPSAYPPMAALRAIEAAVRLESFTAAARELNLTQSAISQAVRQFEDRAGIALFRRTPEGLRATPGAKAYGAALAQALAAIRQAGEALMSTPRPLVVGFVRSLLHSWLTPRLPDFIARHPDVVTSIIGLGRDLDEARQCDVALVIADDGAAPEDAIRFARETLVAVADATLAQRLGGFLEDRPDIDIPLLGTTWPLWRQAAGIGSAAPGKIVQFREISAVLNAVRMGQGIGLLPHLVCDDAIRRGDLVEVSRIAVDRGRSYWLLASDHPASATFVGWLTSARLTGPL